MKASGKICCLHTYHPKSRFQQDEISQLILSLKTCRIPAIARFTGELLNWLEDDVVLCVVPSSDPNHTDTGIARIASVLCRFSKRLDATTALQRIKAVPRSRGDAASRPTVEVHRASLKVIQPEFIRGRTVVVLDDILTTGATMAAAIANLEEAGARLVLGRAIAKTCSYPGRFGVKDNYVPF